jgi:NitT/TauT family transport system permease protein
VTRQLRSFGFAALGVALFVALWEGYKAIDGKLFGWQLPASADDVSMPHVGTIVSRLFDPEQRGSSRTVLQAVLEASWFTMRVAAVGFAIGAVVGIGLAIVMQRYRLAERGLLPFVIISQTVPLVALAPLVVIWGGRLELFGIAWQPWMSVALVASYLAFCPIAIGALRGLQSPNAASVELMRSFAATNRATLFKLRFPAAVPYLVPGLRLGAAGAVVGAIVAEISTGAQGGIGRLILTYAQRATSDPARVYTAVLGAALLGLVVAGMIALLDKVLMRHRQPLGGAAP